MEDFNSAFTCSIVPFVIGTSLLEFRKQIKNKCAKSADFYQYPDKVHQHFSLLFVDSSKTCFSLLTSLTSRTLQCWDVDKSRVNKESS